MVDQELYFGALQTLQGQKQGRQLVLRTHCSRALRGSPVTWMSRLRALQDASLALINPQKTQSHLPILRAMKRKRRLGARICTPAEPSSTATPQTSASSTNSFRRPASSQDKRQRGSGTPHREHYPSLTCYTMTNPLYPTHSRVRP